MLQIPLGENLNIFPSIFQIRIAGRVIKLFSFKNDVILDPFNGSGTTTKVARNLNRHYIGIDLSKNYVNLALERLKE